MNLPVQSDNARLPSNYEQAKQYLAQTENIDECKDWADKAEALASYARQANDTELEHRAQRIRARAIRRAGELLKQIDGRNGQNLPTAKNDGAVIFSREQAAREAGLSERQSNTAVRVANVPEQEFEQQLESGNPPTTTQLAEQGTKKRNIVELDGIDPKLYARATELQGALRRLAEFCNTHDARLVASAFKAHEVEETHRRINTINEWMDVFAVNLNGGTDR